MKFGFAVFFGVVGVIRVAECIVFRGMDKDRIRIENFVVFTFLREQLFRVKSVAFG